MQMSAAWVRCVLGMSLVSCVMSSEVGESILVFEWSELDFTWSSQEKTEFINNGSFVPEKNLIAGIKVYNSQVYVTIPRWRATSGIPVTLAKVESGRLAPYPDWAWQTVADCRRLQYAQSMEIDPNTGLMYVLDTGRIGLASATVTPRDLCPPKIVVFDLNLDEHVASYQLDSVSKTNNFINDIVLDYLDGILRYAYITDVSDVKLHVFDFKTHRSWSLFSDYMKPESDGKNIFINNVSYTFDAAIDGIAMSADFQHVYFCPLGGRSLYQVPTTALRQASLEGVQLVGEKVSQSDGLAIGSSGRLYYGSLADSAVHYWDSTTSWSAGNNQVLLTKDQDTMQWPDTFAFDEAGWLWFVSNRLHLFANDLMNFTSSESNMRIWKVFVNDTSYLYQAGERTRSNSGSSTTVNKVYQYGLLTVACVFYMCH